MENKSLTFLPMSEKELEIAEEMARRLGMGGTTVLNTTCDAPGLHLLPQNKGDRGGSICNTEQFGLVYLADLNDLGFEDLGEAANN